MNEWDEFTGRLEAPETVEVRPRVSGQIDQVAFTEGALVKKGDLLFQIDPRPFQAEVRRLEAQLQQARASASRSDNEAQRGQRLKTANAISAELAESRSSAAQEARAAMAGIQAQLDLARLNLSFTRVTAPSAAASAAPKSPPATLSPPTFRHSPAWSPPTRSTPTSTPTNASTSNTPNWPAPANVAKPHPCTWG